MRFGIAIGWAAALILAAWLLRGHRARRLWILYALGAAALPFSLPPAPLLWRAVATGYAIVLAIKAHALMHGHDVDPEMTARPGRFLVFLAVPHLSRWPRTTGEARAARLNARRPFLRATAKFLALVGVLHLKPWLPQQTFVLSAVNLGEFYLLLTGLADSLAALAGAGGVAVEDVFRAPWRSTSPADFWGRRWNVFVGGFLRRTLFAALVRRGRPVLGLAAAFLASGALHEYLVLAMLGWAHWPAGSMMAFFGLQGAAVLLMRGLSRPLAMTLHLVWLVSTAPFFFGPLAPAVRAFEETTRALVASAL